MKYFLFGIGFFSSFFLMSCSHSFPLEAAVPAEELSKKSVHLGEKTFFVEVADTPETLARGLMFRDSLAKNEGMLFVFPDVGIHSFWMKNTKIPLDIAWISADKIVVDIQSMMPCETDPCPSFVPQKEALYALEVPAGQLGENLLGQPILFP